MQQNLAHGINADCTAQLSLGKLATSAQGRRGARGHPGAPQVPVLSSAKVVALSNGQLACPIRATASKSHFTAFSLLLGVP